jgi:hypothetical protein
MNPRTLLVAGATSALALALFACGGGNEATDPIPPDLAAVESAAEGGFDAALAANAAEAALANTEVARSWALFRTRAAKDGVPASDVSRVDTAVASLGTAITAQAPALDIGRAFNGVSAPMASIYAVYKPAIPATLLDLDYLGRELMLDARRSDMAAATAHAQQLNAAWAALRAKVLAASGSTQATLMDNALAQVGSAITAADATRLEAAAVAETDAVDVVEQLFADREKDHD